ELNRCSRAIERITLPTVVHVAHGIVTVDAIAATARGGRRMRQTTLGVPDGRAPHNRFSVRKTCRWGEYGSPRWLGVSFVRQPMHRVPRVRCRDRVGTA